uniref:Minor capsid protein P9 transmembrane helices domain-containing protein n=1 Tax=viral metagenome TaxID=1070528 RepID=A0A6C0ELE4_9ZZZZ
MTCVDKKFWLENLGALFSSIQVVPTHTMNLAQQLNSITRLLLIVFIIMLLFNFKYSVHFLVISIVFIIIIYYMQRKTMSKCQEKYSNPTVVEYYKPPSNYLYAGPQPSIPQNPKSVAPPPDMRKYAQTRMANKGGKEFAEAIIETPEKLPFCNDVVDVNSSFNFSMNQTLAGGDYGGKYRPNPKTLVAPIIKPPSHDLSYWRDNNLTTYSAINSEPGQIDMYASGYAVSTCCGYLNEGSELVPEPNQQIPQAVGGRADYKEGYGIVSPVPTVDNVFVPTLPVKEGYAEIVSPVPTVDNVFVPTMPYIKEGYERKNEKYTPLKTVENPNWAVVQPNQPGWVNTSCGYNPDQLFEAGLPANLPTGNCEQDPVFKQYNENLYTQTVTPGVYTRNQVNEPINSNIGISFQQQFEPTTCNRNDKGLNYLQHDPRIIEPAIFEPVTSVKEKAVYDNVYDPRFYGYGTSYRSYIDPVTGQPRYMYDDINAIRMPNYITRSKVDFLPYADSYGPVQAGSEFGNRLNPNIRELAQDSWMRDSLQFRNDMTERRMRKINSEMWQKRQFPHGPGQANSYKC